MSSLHEDNHLSRNKPKALEAAVLAAAGAIVPINFWLRFLLIKIFGSPPFLAISVYAVLIICFAAYLSIRSVTGDGLKLLKFGLDAAWNLYTAFAFLSLLLFERGQSGAIEANANKLNGYLFATLIITLGLISSLRVAVAVVEFRRTFSARREAAPETRATFEAVHGELAALRERQAQIETLLKSRVKG